MKEFEYTVVVTAANKEQADVVIRERVGYDEDLSEYGVPDYQISLKETPAERLAYLRREIEAEQISYFEIAELASLAEHIDPSDTLLLEWAGVPEHAEEN